VRFLRGRRKRQLSTAFVVAAAMVVFFLEWHGAPRVEIEPAVAAQLRSVPPGELYLGEKFEGLPLRSVRPFVYSDCKPGVPKRSPSPCHVVTVDRGAVSGSSVSQVSRARRQLYPVGRDIP
jgi:hypothetical protein